MINPFRLSGDLQWVVEQLFTLGRANLLVDEPLSNLDARLRDEMRWQIKRLLREITTTMIYVTHDQIEAMTLAVRVVLRRDGLIEQ